MQFKNICSRVPPLANMKLWYNRWALSRIAKAYSALTLVHCIAQVVLQARDLGINRTHLHHLRHIMNVNDVSDKFAILDSSGAILICHAIPGYTSDPHPCENFLVNASGVATTSLNGTLDTCSQVLAWPAQILHQAIRESIAMTVFQAWLRGISIVAIVTESIPHIVAALVTQLLSTAWSLFHIGRTQYLHRLYNTLVVEAACNNVDPLPNYWESIFNNQIPVLALNVASLVIFVILSWKLCKQFGVQSFTRVGGSKRIHHLYLMVLVLFVFLQLTTFFLTTSLILWIEQLFDGPIAVLADKQTAYLSAFIGNAVLIIPWLYMGWTAVRRERRRIMVVFLFISIFLIVSQMGMFLSPIYRVTFSTWNFFGSVTVIAYILLNLSFFMALVCRYFFGRGLAQFLQVQKALGECDFTPVYIERGSPMSEGAKDTEGGPMPWDVEGRSVVKKMSLPQLSQNHDSADLPSVRSTTSSTFSGSLTPQSALHVSSSQATDSHDSPVILDGGEMSSSADDGSGNASSDRLSNKSKSSTRSEHLGGSIRPPEENNTAGRIRRGLSFPSASGDGVRRPLVGLPPSVNRKLRCPPNLVISVPRGYDFETSV